jgi:multidrug resistance efflux pump
MTVKLTFSASRSLHRRQWIPPSATLTPPSNEAGVRAAEERARLELTSTISGENTTVAQVRQQLAAAENDVTETKVVAPCDGFVSNVNILPGQIVTPGSAVMWGT